MVKECVERRGTLAQGTDLRQILLIARQGRQPIQSAVRRVMVNRFTPRPQPRVEIIQIGHAAVIVFAQELVAKGAVPAFELAFAFWRVRAAIN